MICFGVCSAEGLNSAPRLTARPCAKASRNTHSPHGLSVAAVAVVVAPSPAARTEAEAVRVVVDREERTRPVAAAGETRPIGVACRGQKEAVAVRRSEQSAVHAVLRRPNMRRVI